MGCTPLDEQRPGNHKEARAEELVRRRAAHDYWFQPISVLLYVDDDAGALQTLVLMYRSYVLSKAYECTLSNFPLSREDPQILP